MEKFYRYNYGLSPVIENYYPFNHVSRYCKSSFWLRLLSNVMQTYTAPEARIWMHNKNSDTRIA